MTTDEQFLTVADVCARWNIDPRTLDKLVEAGGLGCVIYPAPVRLRRFPLTIVMDYERQHLRVSS